MGSKGAKVLAQKLSIKRVFPDRKYRHKPSHMVVNWGSSLIPTWKNDNNLILNSPVNILKAVNKISTFTILKENGVPTPMWTTDFDEAKDMLAEGKTVVCRETVTGTCGVGITIVSPEDFDRDGLPMVKLYTEFIPKAREYRVHVFCGEVIFLQQKKRRRVEGDSPDGKIKNSSNWWVFCHGDVTEPTCGVEKLYAESIKAISSLGLDFGAVDIMVKRDNVYILEVNTACGLEGTTIEKYEQAIIKKYNDFRTT